VWLDALSAGDPERREVLVIRKTELEVAVRFEATDGPREETYDARGWEDAKPEGRRDWRILVAMPTVFLALGIMSHRFPSLLGNGRALAEVAIHRARTTGVFVLLLFLKGIMTAMSIGAGAAGGTLTPSVAIGATLGAVVGEALQAVMPFFAPEHDGPMSVVASAAFLAVAMRSPVTSLWLLVEFSAQGIGRNALVALFRGNVSGLLASKLAIGMLLPMSIAVAGAMLAVKAIGRLATSQVPAPAPEPEPSPASPTWSANLSAVSPTVSVASPRSVTQRNNTLESDMVPSEGTLQLKASFSRFRKQRASFDLDLREHVDTSALVHEEGNKGGTTDGDKCSLDKAACALCFGTGLLLNTCLTIGCAAMLQDCPGAVTAVSASGVACAAAAGAVASFCAAAWRRGPFWRWPSGGFEELAMAPREEEAPEMPPSAARTAAALAYGMLLAAAGAAVPLAPWVIWDQPAGDSSSLAAIAASAASAVAAGACSAAVQADGMVAVGREALGIALTAVLAYGAGALWNMHLGLLSRFSTKC